MGLDLHQLRNLPCFGKDGTHPYPALFSPGGFVARFEVGNYPSRTCRDKETGFQWIAPPWWDGRVNLTTWTPSLDDPATRGCLQGLITDAGGEGSTQGEILAATLITLHDAQCSTDGDV